MSKKKHIPYRIYLTIEQHDKITRINSRQKHLRRMIDIIDLSLRKEKYSGIIFCRGKGVEVALADKMTLYEIVEKLLAMIEKIQPEKIRIEVERHEQGN